MSEQNTSEPKTIASGPKVKDPIKVAAGKKLGAITVFVTAQVPYVCPSQIQTI